MVAIMQVNGEGTPVDLRAARASLERVDSKDADFEALLKIITTREANPGAKVKRVDFCRDVAMTTPSFNVCQANVESKKAAKGDAELKKIRSGLDKRLQPIFDRAKTAFEKFVKADGDRVYQEYIDGSSRNQEAMDQEARARRNFMATVKRMLAGPVSQLAGQRAFAAADKELNELYNAKVSSYVTSNEESAVDAEKAKDKSMAVEYRTRNSDYKTKFRAAQHEWVRYRDAMGDLASARWPDVREAREQARALVTEDRVRELRAD
ncbi:MAG TPA: lysozyme inhibitor LprI family protein [Polyangia bacterium]|nr:lysozyme inhibitor LprI family protein [Polyangia bacterium]